MRSTSDGSVYLPAGRTIYQMKYYVNGRPVRKSTGTSNEKDAWAILRQHLSAAEQDADVPSRRAHFTLDDAVRDVMDDYRLNDQSSVRDVERRWRLHLKPYFGGWEMASIRTDDLRNYTKRRKDQKAAKASINLELAIVKRAYHLAHENEKLTAMPYIPMLDISGNERTGFFEPEHMEAVVAHLPDRLKPVMRFAYYTGWRVPSEVITLPWSQVDDFNVRLTPSQTKTKTGRAFPYHKLPELAAVIAAQRAKRNGPYVFPNVFGEQQTRFYMREWNRAWAKAKLDIDRKVPHDFRRSAARNLINVGVDEKTAMMLTGHKTREVFRRYQIVNEENLKDAVTKLAERSKRTA